MNKARWLLVVNAFLLLSIIMQALTGLMLFLNMFTYREELISRVHAYNGFVLAGLIAIHLALNWNWVKANFFKKVGRA